MYTAEWNKKYQATILTFTLLLGNKLSLKDKIYWSYWYRNWFEIQIILQNIQLLIIFRWYFKNNFTKTYQLLFFLFLEIGGKLFILINYSLINFIK